jgi:ribosomal protein L40E
MSSGKKSVKSLLTLLTISTCILSLLLVSSFNPTYGALAPSDSFSTNIPIIGYYFFTPTKISINDGLSFTNTRTVNVFVNATAANFLATGIQLSNDNSSWGAYAYSAPTTRSWTLTPGDGLKTTYVKFYNSTTISSSYSDTITLDTLAPTLTITTPTNESIIQQTICAMNWTSSDASSGISNFEVWTDSAAHITLTPTTKSYVFAGLSEESHKFNVKATDAAGNTQTQTVNVNISIPPGTGSILISNGALFTTTPSVTLNLAASSGVSEMSFNTPENSTWSSWENFTTTKSWTFSGSDGTKIVSVMYKFSGIATPSTPLDATILLDTTPPEVSITEPLNGAQLNTTTCQASWTATDVTSGIDHFEIKIDNDDWLYVSNLTTYPIIGLPEGPHILSVKAFDKSGLFQTATANIVISVAGATTTAGPTASISPTQNEDGQFPTMIIIIIVVVLVAVILGVLFLVKFMRKPKKPQLKVKAEPANLVADGQTKATITLQLVDKKGNPLAALSDTPIRVTTQKGRLQDTVVTIPKGKDAEKTFIISSTETGPVLVSVDAEGLKSITITMNFTEKTRYCMHCGTIMALKAKMCTNCGKAPPAGDDTKQCEKCNAVIPIVAKFCSECGAGQVA